MISSKPAAGFTTLTITLIVVILVTSLSLMTGKILMGEQRVAANEMRYRAAMASAQAGLDEAMARVGADLTFRGPLTRNSGTFYSVTFGADQQIPVGTGQLPLLSLRSVGTSEDGEGQVILHQQVVISDVVAGTPDAPLTVAAGMAVGGNFNVGANPNGGGSGVPLSIWTNGNVDLTTGSGNTCGLQEYYDGNCSSASYSSAGNKQADILDNDTVNFPSDLLKYVFGVPDTDEGMAQLEERLAKLGRVPLTGCSSLNTSSSGFYIVDGNCSGGSMGSRENPVVVLVRNGDLTINANSEIYGMVFTYDKVPGDVTTYDVKLNGGATVYGALISNHKLGTANGTYNAVYDAETLQNIQDGKEFSYVARVPGSWRDWD
ncbi:pilus assembly PilX N-terminal domain-containing protein [Pseudaeromonas paramecii]|uniref:Type 4 fimbrial biogenesis protein PilX N-terminal domain-containing protein n=1 Tax=Pseudaeromonas paramecii TaxID=2138166 RepID=A0ABP8QA84_9GAMM